MTSRSFTLMLALAVLLVSTSSVALPRDRSPTLASVVYLPAVVGEPALFRVELTLSRNSCAPPSPSCQFPPSHFVAGYAYTLTDTPIYSATVTLSSVWSYYGEEPTTGVLAHQLRTALPAVLPGQPNPFQVEYQLYRDDVFFVRVEAGTSSRTSTSGRTYHALTVGTWSRTGSTVQGTVRNNTAWTLLEAQVVVSHPSCPWQNATLSATTLGPGEQARFTVSQVSCAAADLRIVGQGAANK